MVRISNILSVIDENIQVELYGTEGHICTIMKRSHVPENIYYRSVEKIHPVDLGTICVVVADKRVKS